MTYALSATCWRIRVGPNRTAPELSAQVHAVSERTRALRDAHVLGARALRALSALKRHGLALAKLIEARACARRLVKEVLAAVACRNKAKSLVGQPLDRAVHRRHRYLAGASLKESSSGCT